MYRGLLRGPVRRLVAHAGTDFLIEAGDGVMSSVNFFDTSAQAEESTRVVADWLRNEKLETIVPNSPKITLGEVIVHRMNGS